MNHIVCIGLEIPRKLFYLHEDSGSAHNVPAEGRRTNPRFLDDVLEARVVEEQLREHLLQDLHAVAEVGKVDHYVVAHVLDACFPLVGEIPHLS